MIRNFVAGLVWGAVVAGVGLGVISQVAPMPARMAAPHDTAASDTALPETVTPPDALDPAAEPETVVTQTVAPQEVPVEPVAPDALAQSDTLTEAAPEAAPAKPATQTAQPAPEPAAPQPAPQADAPAAPATTEESQSAPSLAGDQSAPALPMPSAQPDSQTSDPAPTAPDLPPPAPVETDEALLTPAPAPATQPEPALVTPDAPPAPETMSPDTSLPKLVDGVTTGRLPAIGETDRQPETEATAASQPPIDRFARPFENPTAKPMFALVLMDSGAPDLDRAKLAALPFPVTFVIDPAAPDAATAAQIYRAAGQEVVMLASGIPAGATASDLEQTFQSHATTLPEAVAVLDLASDGFQDNRPLATLVVPVLKSQGRGLLTFDRGLNAADQVARRDGVRAATIFRILDSEGEDTPLIRRYLDRAAFKAAQEGRVVVLGQTRAETVAAILEWTVEGRASSVALAPLTAVLITPN